MLLITFQSLKWGSIFAAVSSAAGQSSCGKGQHHVPARDALAHLSDDELLARIRALESTIDATARPPAPLPPLG